MGRCSHVAALLYILLKYLNEIKENSLPCTSKLCTWNHGRKRKEPHKVNEQPYKNKIGINKRQSYDPGNSLMKPVDNQRINNLLSNLQIIRANTSKKTLSMWELLLQLQYNDYELDKLRKSNLKPLVYKLTTDKRSIRQGSLI